MKKIIAAVIGVIGLALIMIGGVLKFKDKPAVTIIGGADGPTSIFLAGKLGKDFSMAYIFIGIAVVALSIFCFLRKRK